MASKLKAFCPKCGVRHYEGKPAPEHRPTCPFLGRGLPVVIYTPATDFGKARNG